MPKDTEIRTLPILLTPFASLIRDIRDIFRNPWAFFGGLLGSLASIATLVLFFVYGQSASAQSSTPEEEELEIDFVPGELVRKGPKLEIKDLPEKIIVEETVAEEEKTVEETVTKKDDPVPPPPEEKKEPKPKEEPKKATEKPDPNKKKAKKSDKNRDSNTPFPDLPTVKDLPGDPFGSPQGWSDLAKDGDPWATAVLAAMNGIKVGSFGAEAKKGTFQFRVTVCKDGTVGTVQKKRSSGNDALDSAIITEISRLKLPRPPTAVAKKMKSNCAQIKYQFTWSGVGGGRIN